MKTNEKFCISGGRLHAWSNTGADIVGVVCVYTAKCVWCGKQAARLSPTDQPYRDGTRIRP